MWKTAKLKDICSVFTDGDWIETKHQSLDGIRLIQTGNVKIGNFADREDKARYITEETFNQLNCKAVREGDLLVSRLPEPVGRACMIPKLKAKAITAVDCTIIRTKEFVLPTFLNYYMQSPRYFSAVQEKVTGATRQRISRKNLGEIDIKVPPLAEQQRIVDKLDAAFAEIDKAIEVTEQKITYAVSLKSNSLTSLFFDSEYVVKELREIALIKGGKRLPKGKKLTTENTGFPYIRVSDFNDNGTVEEESIQYVEPDVQSQIARYTISSDDVYVSIAGTIGKTGVVPPNLDNANLTENAAKLVLNEGVDRDFVYFFTQTSSFEKQAIKQTRQVAQPKLALERLGDVKLPFCELHEQLQIAANAKLMTQKIVRFIDNRKDKIVRLAALKSAILAQELNPSEAA